MTRRDAMAVGWTVLLLAACLAPGRWLGLREVPFRGLGPFGPDKLIHAALFAGYAFLWILSERGRGMTPRILALGVTLAVLTEAVQGLPFVRRDPDPFDVLADVVGLGIGQATVLGAAFVWRSMRRRALEASSVER